MRRLHPAPAADVEAMRELAAAERNPPPGRPWVMLNMVASVDGAAAVDGLSGSLGGDADKEVFMALRALPDAIMAASGTVKAEDYGPSRPSAEVRAARVARGQSEVPPIAVVTGSVDFDWDHRFFADAQARPIVVTTSTADAARVARAAEVADVIATGEEGVDLGAALGELAERGVGLLLVEGGPSLNGQLLRQGLVDELHMTLSPALVGGEAIRIVRGEAPDVPCELSLAGVIQADDVLFLRYLAVRPRT